MNTLFRRTRGLWFFLNCATIIFGGVYVWIVGHKGVCLYDQSTVFDGGWRMLQGQVPYVDFYMPYGPITLFIQSMFFRLTGVDFSSMVLSAAVLNALAVLAVIWVVRRFFPELVHAPTAIGAGLLTAVWFQAQYGTLWFDQTAFFFNLIAVVLLIKAATCSNRTAFYLRVAAGCLLPLSVLSKQTAGFIFLPVPLGVAIITCLPHWRKATTALYQILAGMFIVSGLFLVWLWTFSSISGFWQSVVVMSRTLAGTRVARIDSVWNLLLLNPTLEFVAPALVAFFIFAVSKRAFATPNSLLISWILLSYVFLQNVFAALTNQDLYNSLSLLGIINGLAFGLVCRVFWKEKSAGQSAVLYWSKAAVPLVAVFFLFYRPGYSGYNFSINRVVQQFDYDATFAEPLSVPGMTRLNWGNPTPVGSWTIAQKDFEGLNAWLDEVDGNFFVLTDATILYGLHKRVSPQPWLCFMREHSFRMADIAFVDDTVVRSLKKNNVSVIVREKTTFGGDHEVFEQMPQLQSWMRNDFEKVREFGLYEVWALRERAAF